ncbi:T9SS type B sorting domain-containing protein, partial [Flavobacterium magnesitis]
IENIKIINNNNYLTGDFMWSCDFDPSITSVYNLESVNQVTINRDGFILKLGPCDYTEPIGDKDQYFCTNQNPTIGNLTPNSNSIKWYESLSSTNELISTISLNDNQIYYAARQIGSCPESPRLAVTAHITQSPQAPTFTPPVFCKNEHKKLSDIIINGINISWYDSLSDGLKLSETIVLENNITYYASQTVNGCESERVQITPIIIETVLLSANSPQTFCIQQNATLDNIVINGQNIQWYDALTNGNLLANTTLLQSNTTYYASQTINGCESERVAILISIQNTPPATADVNQSFCTGSNPRIAEIQVTGQNIKWYDALNNGSLLTETTNLVDGKTYYASQTVNNCESERLAITVSVVNTPSTPTANGNQSFCKKENATLNNVQISGQNIRWYDTNFSAASLPNTTLLEDNKTYYASQTIGCESDRTPVLIRVYETPLPTANNNQLFCMDENATIANLSISGSNIKWYEDTTNGTVLAETSLLQNNKTYYATQTLNDCESERLAVTVEIQDTQNPITNSPQIFCVQENAKISDITISGQNINWFESVSSSINLSESTLLENGIVYYASQTINSCESDRIPISITILEATTGDCINFVDKLPFPKFFTPNNDGYNDTWAIDFAYLAPNTGIKIYDRYGKLLKVLLPNSSWNGQFNNQELPATDYWFVVTRANGQEYKGHFSLKR